jgi:hypothetical protein
MKMRNCNSAYDSQFSSNSVLTSSHVYLIQKENEGYRFFVWQSEEDSRDDDGAMCIDFDFGDRTDEEIIDFLRDSVAEEI